MFNFFSNHQFNAPKPSDEWELTASCTGHPAKSCTAHSSQSSTRHPAKICTAHSSQSSTGRPGQSCTAQSSQSSTGHPGQSCTAHSNKSGTGHPAKSCPGHHGQSSNASNTQLSPGSIEPPSLVEALPPLSVVELTATSSRLQQPTLPTPSLSCSSSKVTTNLSVLF